MWGLVSERTSVLDYCMDWFEGSPGQFRDFKKGDFEANWIKLAECRFNQVYQVKLKVWREKCALKSFDTTLCGNNFYRWDLNYENCLKMFGILAQL